MPFLRITAGDLAAIDPLINNSIKHVLVPPTRHECLPLLCMAIARPSQEVVVERNHFLKTRRRLAMRGNYGGAYCAKYDADIRPIYSSTLPTPGTPAPEDLIRSQPSGHASVLPSSSTAPTIFRTSPNPHPNPNIAETDLFRSIMCLICDEHRFIQNPAMDASPRVISPGHRKDRTAHGQPSTVWGLAYPHTGMPLLPH